MWTPLIQFLKVVNVRLLPPYGKESKKYDFQGQLKDNGLLMTFYQSLKVTTACDFDFSDFPFDDHYCNVDFGMPEYGLNYSLYISPIQVLNNDTTAVFVNEEKYIKNGHLPFHFYVTTKNQFPFHNFEFMAPYVGLTFHLKRKSLGSLTGSFYVPTAIFSALSLISFFIKPDVVSILNIVQKTFYEYVLFTEFYFISARKNGIVSNFTFDFI